MVKIKFPKQHSSAAQELATDLTAERPAAGKLPKKKVICPKEANCLEDKDEEAAMTSMHGFGETFKPHYPK